MIHIQNKIASQFLEKNEILLVVMKRRQLGYKRVRKLHSKGLFQEKFLKTISSSHLKYQGVQFNK